MNPAKIAREFGRLSVAGTLVRCSKTRTEVRATKSQILFFTSGISLASLATYSRHADHCRPRRPLLARLPRLLARYLFAATSGRVQSAGSQRAARHVRQPRTQSVEPDRLHRNTCHAAHR